MYNTEMTYTLKFRQHVLAIKTQEKLTYAQTATRFCMGIASLMRWFHRSSYRYLCRPNVLDVELTVKRSLVSEAWNVSGGSAGARSIATMVTNTHGVKLGR